MSVTLEINNYKNRASIKSQFSLISTYGDVMQTIHKKIGNDRVIEFRISEKGIIISQINIDECTGISRTVEHVTRQDMK